MKANLRVIKGVVGLVETGTFGEYANNIETGEIMTSTREQIEEAIIQKIDACVKKGDIPYTVRMDKESVVAWGKGVLENPPMKEDRIFTVGTFFKEVEGKPVFLPTGVYVAVENVSSVVMSAFQLGNVSKEIATKHCYLSIQVDESLKGEVKIEASSRQSNLY